MNGQEQFTLDDLANTNLGVEVTTADRGVEPGARPLLARARDFQGGRALTSRLGEGTQRRWEG